MKKSVSRGKAREAALLLNTHTPNEAFTVSRRDGAAIRGERMRKIAQTIQKQLHQHGEIPLSQTVAFFAYDKGLTKAKVREYLGILEELGQFLLDEEGDKIHPAVEERELSEPRKEKD